MNRFAYDGAIKFTAEISTERVTFLDTTVILEDDTLHTDLYTKPTDRHQYLTPSSCHPRHCTTTIPYSQGLRLRSICSRREDFEKRSNELRDHLLARGYEANSIDRQIQRAPVRRPYSPTHDNNNHVVYPWWPHTIPESPP